MNGGRKGKKDIRRGGSREVFGEAYGFELLLLNVTTSEFYLGLLLSSMDRFGNQSPHNGFIL